MKNSLYYSATARIRISDLPDSMTMSKKVLNPALDLFEGYFIIQSTLISSDVFLVFHVYMSLRIKISALRSAIIFSSFYCTYISN